LGDVSSSNPKLWIAIAIFFGGIGFAAWSLISSRPTPPPRPERTTEAREEVEPDPRVETMITSADYRVMETPDLLDALREGLKRELSDPRLSDLNSAQRADLERAIIARFSYVYSPDLETNLRDLRQRGYTISDERAAEEYQRVRAWRPERPIDPDTVWVRRIHADPSANRLAGYSAGSLSYTDDRTGLPTEPAADGYLVMEATVALKQPAPQVGGTVSEESFPLLAGYRFAWSPELGRWIPYTSIGYRSGGGAFMLPF